MSRFLSPEWIDEMHRAASTSSSLTAAAPADEPLVVQHVVTADGDNAGGTFHVIVAADDSAVIAGTAEDPTVTFTQSYGTAAGIAGGTLSAQAAFMAGDLRIGGRVDRLMAEHAVLAGLDDVFAAVRSSTEY